MRRWVGNIAGAVVGACVFIAGLALASSAASTATKMSSTLEHRISTASTNTPIAVWVVFADKPDASAATLRDIESHLSAHARARRERNRAAGQLVDAYDVPVSAAHIAAVSRTGAHIRHISRWLNAVSVDATAQEIAEIAALAPVARIDVVHRGHVPDLEIESRPPAREAMRAPSQKLSYDYGSSFFQNILMDVPAMHDLGFHGEGIVIALLDTGFNNLSHPALANLDVLLTYDFVNGDPVVRLFSPSIFQNAVTTIFWYACHPVAAK